MSKKQLPILYSNLLNKMGNYLLDTQYTERWKNKKKFDILENYYDETLIV